MIRRLPFIVLAALLVVGYGIHAYHGALATLGIERARAADYDEEWLDAVDAFQLAARGAQRARGLREAAERYVDLWEEQVNLGGHIAGDPAVLDAALSGFLDCLCAAPASRRPWSGMSEVYEYLEWADRERRATEPAPLPDNPWSAIGRPGRISVGLARLASERAPTWYAVRDTLARRLWRFGARDAALEAVDQAARVLPIYTYHDFDADERHGQVFLEAFARASRDVIGKTPLVHPTDHLIDLGKVELQSGDVAGALDALTRALDSSGDKTNRAEAQFNLGLALMQLDRMDEARGRFRESSEHPAFESQSLFNLATIAEREGDAETAMQSLRRLRRLDPQNVEYCLRFAEAARRLERWDAALESLRWARLRHPDDARVLRALGETQLDAGDGAAARQTLIELGRMEEGGAEFERLRAAIAEAHSRY